MDKVELSVKDIEALLKWRDQHPQEIKSHPAPLKAVEIVMPHNGYRIKGIREGDQLRLHLSQNGTQLGNCRFVRRPDGMWASTRNRMQVGRDDLQAVLTVYCSVMALMAYGRREVEPQDTTPEPGSKPSPSKRPTKRKSKRTTYILRSINGALSAVPRGSHASPRGIFTVRGHYRHYKSGKVVWVSEYQKGTGKRKGKTYKLGG
jgi:hypothetical protein